jgi:hypothetical protein
MTSPQLTRLVRMMAASLLLTLALGCARSGPSTPPSPPPDHVQPPPLGPTPLPIPPTPPPEVLVPYTGAVQHIFFHPLIAYPSRAFDGDGMARGYNDWFVTVKEFVPMLKSLYQHDFILIDIRTLSERGSDGNLHANSLQLPPGKKPLVLSIDDLNYYAYMRENGNVDRLVLDGKGRVETESTDEKGERVRSRTNEIIPLLDDFVADHPDFSFHGAKGLIALTGYEGILGFRTNDKTASNYAQERASAIAVAERLTATGWAFASHGWGHLDAAKISYNGFATDTRRWKAEVEPLIGSSSIYVYPFGSTLLPSDPKFQFLREQGFTLFCGIGPNPFLEVRPSYVRMDRRHIDGIALHSQQRLLQDLFDADAVIDPVRPATY